MMTMIHDASFWTVFVYLTVRFVLGVVWRGVCWWLPKMTKSYTIFAIGCMVVLRFPFDVYFCCDGIPFGVVFICYCRYGRRRYAIFLAIGWVRYGDSVGIHFLLSFYSFI